MHFKVNKNKGVALIMVLMISAVMAVIMLYMSSKGQNNARLAGLVKQHTNAKLNIENAQAELIYSYMSTPFSITGPRTDFQGEEIKNQFTRGLAGQENKLPEYTVKVQDLSGLISLVPLNRRDFSKLLINQGVSQQQLLRILDRLDDWQDPDNLTRLEGAEAGDYNVPHLPKNGVIQSPKELIYILEDEELYRKIQPYIGLYGSDYTVRQFMPNSLYSALGIMQGASQADSAEGPSYPSGRYLVEITSTNNTSVTKKFTLLRGRDSFRPYFITDDELIFR